MAVPNHDCRNAFTVTVTEMLVSREKLLALDMDSAYNSWQEAPQPVTKLWNFKRRHIPLVSFANISQKDLGNLRWI